MPEPSAGPSALRVYRATQALRRAQQCEDDLEARLRPPRRRGAARRTAVAQERLLRAGPNAGAPRGVAVPTDAAAT